MTSDKPRNAQDWATWFWDHYFAAWLDRVQDGDAGVFDALDASGAPDLNAGKTVLAQARTLFTLSHLGLLSGDRQFEVAARPLVTFLDHFRKAPGLYRNKINRDGTISGAPADNVTRSYDMTFVILALVTWNKLSPSDAATALIDDCWTALQTVLIDTDTSLLLNDDSGKRSNPAQNPHMHLYEACLQAYQMSEEDIWLARAAHLREIGLRHFMDPRTGSIAEFITPDLKSLPGEAGQRREIGHQCEWAWLLSEEARLSNLPALTDVATRLTEFADNFGVSANGAVYDAVSADGAIVENSFLLWPQTEAIKILATHHSAKDAEAGTRASDLLCVMFEGWFADRPVYINQLDAAGETIWSEALTRLMYHVVLAMTEGAKAGLWPNIPVQITDKPA